MNLEQEINLFIRHSVGFGGANDREDVLRIQKSLNDNQAVPRLYADGICGPMTISAIRNFQSRFMLSPDGRVDPGGKSLRELSHSLPHQKTTEEPIITPVRTSYWEGDSSKWSKNKKLESLDSAFRKKVKEIVDELAMRQFKPKIFFAWRSVDVQLELYRKGNSTVTFSFHNAQKKDGAPHAFAVDIIDRRWAWGAAATQNGFWQALGEAAHARQAYWGGDWVSFKDWAHIQHFPNSELKRIKRESGIAAV